MPMNRSLFRKQMAYFLSLLGLLYLCSGCAVRQEPDLLSMEEQPLSLGQSGLPLPISAQKGEIPAALGSEASDYMLNPPLDPGHGSFTEAGALLEAHQELILKYMDRFYLSLVDLKPRGLEDIFAEDAAAQRIGNSTVWEYLIEIRKMQPADLSLVSYQYDLTLVGSNWEEDGSASVWISEHSIQNFASCPNVDAEQFHVIHLFVLTPEQDEWKISRHVQWDSLYRIIMSPYAAPEEGFSYEDAEAIQHYEKQKELLLARAKNYVSERPEQGEEGEPQYEHAYDREAAVGYALDWVENRNEDWDDYSLEGGNCQNYVSQCLLAGGIPMDTQEPGIWKWYGSTPNSLPQMTGRSASWSSVKDFLTYAETNTGFGLSATPNAPYYSGQRGDLIHLAADDEDWRHTVMITDVLTDDSGKVLDYLVSSNTADLKNFPASAYSYAHQILIQIHGWND